MGDGQVGCEIGDALPVQSREYAVLLVNEKLCSVTLLTNTCALLESALVPFTVDTVTWCVPQVADTADRKNALICASPLH